MSTNTTPLSQLTPALSFQPTDLVLISHSNGDGTYTSQRVTGAQIVSTMPTINSVRLGQFKRALAGVSSTLPLQIQTSLEADPGDTYNIAWTSDPFVFVGCPLYNYVQAFLSYSPAQMTALLAAALIEPG